MVSREVLSYATRRRGDEGRVQMIGPFDGAGRPTNCRVVDSSGSVILDRETSGLLMKNARLPAIDGGQPAIRFVYVPIVWRLED